MGYVLTCPSHTSQSKLADKVKDRNRGSHRPCQRKVLSHTVGSKVLRLSYSSLSRCLHTAPKCVRKSPDADRFTCKHNCTNCRMSEVDRNLCCLESGGLQSIQQRSCVCLDEALAPAEAQVSSLGQCLLLFISGPRFHIQDGPSPSLRPRRDSLCGSLSSRKPSCECRVHEHRPAP